MKASLPIERFLNHSWASSFVFCMILSRPFSDKVLLYFFKLSFTTDKICLLLYPLALHTSIKLLVGSGMYGIFHILSKTYTKEHSLPHTEIILTPEHLPFCINTALNFEPLGQSVFRYEIRLLRTLHQFLDRPSLAYNLENL